MACKGWGRWPSGVALMTFLDDACETLKQQRDRRSDKRIKQYYDDLLFISDPKNGSFTRSYLTSPYLSELFSTYATGPVVKFSSKEQKGALGEQLYNIVYSNRIGILTAQASKKLEELTALNTGSRSPEFRRMITTLTDVTKLSNKSTPADATMYNNYIISLYKGWLNGVVETIENKKGNTMNNKYFTACGIVEMIGKILLVRHTYGTAKNK